ncbi:sensor histidine kinase [Mucilaginibacter sp. X5P1]|uniref:sensor histidine kinase n=1 Tax=Mucilaginibacter sp. X5P1 TaxID=2723088 RepID=UPI0016081B93|nr:HAMP domain-containing sensor histidine kinase [Mucilaginibacter sp. X5P1]MBB6140137.1 signal transduction histidine kinase [Mucilaginibacter sp. X5P1]
MKLLARYNRVTLMTTVIIMLLTGIAYYQAISWTFTRQKDKDLTDEETEIYEYVNLNHRLPEIFETEHQQVSFTKINIGPVKRVFVDTTYFKIWGKNNPKRQQFHAIGGYEPARGLITSVIIGHQYYKASIIHSKVETEDLIQIIFSITIGVILLLLIILFATNRFILNRLWKPFYNLMQELDLFNITDKNIIPKIDTSIDEFKRLNNSVANMSNKAKRDYQTLKTFTENAAHELNTPIAIINSKLDLLIQTENFSEWQGKLLTELYGGVLRLNRLNQSLLLLVKIENQLMDEHQHINLHELIEGMIIQFDDIYNDKGLKLTYKLDKKEIFASRYLMEILLSNLIINAIRHNYTGGEIIISLTAENFIIQNTGNDEPLNKEEIFIRFHKSSGSEGSGLGLTISRQICENFNFLLDYRFHSPYHAFIVTFPNQV